MYSLVIVIYATAAAVVPPIDGRTSTADAAPPALGVTVSHGGTYPNEFACNQVAQLLHDQDNSHAAYKVEPHCLFTDQATPDQPLASNR